MNAYTRRSFLGLVGRAAVGAAAISTIPAVLHEERWVRAAAATPLRVAAPLIVPFDQWAPAQLPRPTGEDPSEVRRIVVHHTHEPVANTPEEVLPALAEACNAHTDRGFSTLGYHYVVDPWGGVWQGRGGMPDEDGRPPATHGQGAHVAGSNAGAVGVAFLGSHVEVPPTAAALTAATQLMAWVMQDAGVDPGAIVPTTSSGVGTARFNGRFHPRAVTGHSASNTTDCPGEHLRQLLGPMRDRLRQLLAGQQASSWDGLAAEPPPAAAEPAAAEPAAAEPAAAEPAAKPATPSPDAAPAAAGGPSLSSPAPSLAPLVSPVDRAAGTLRDSGLRSLAERLAG